MEKIRLQVPLNRVGGDLEIQVEVQDGVVTDAWSSGIMYRGFENLLVGRGALDGLVITPRICGICSTAHLLAAARALDMISGVHTPPDAIRLRNLAVMVEKMQSDMRHAFLMFATDFTNPVYRDHSLFEEALRRYQPFRGETVLETVRETKRLIEIIAIIGGQWPHSSYMVPGGVTAAPGMSGLMQCRYLLEHFKKWYERRILGCSIERFAGVQSASELYAWVEEKSSQRESDLGVYIRFSREAGLDRFGCGHSHYISYGSMELPENTAVQGKRGANRLAPSGFARGLVMSDFDQELITEHVSHSWFMDSDEPRHPSRGETKPYATGREGKKYSWAKAPRYGGLPAETGPLAEMIISESPLFVDLVEHGGPSVFVRELARLVRSVEIIPVLERWLIETSADASFYTSPPSGIEGRGYGLVQATRGALGHWVSIVDGEIERYQIITPTAWNASPRDDAGIRGPWEEALVGAPVRDMTNPVELGHVVRSFDACLVCTVHLIDRKRA